MKPRIDPEFAAFLPKPNHELVVALTAKLQKEGCRDAIVVWTSENIIVDGHTRFEICESLGLPYKIEYMEFDSRDDVFEWMCETQLSRRNLNDKERAYFIGKQYLQKKKQHGGNRQEQDTVSVPCPTKTAEIVAKANKVSAGTVHTDAKFAEAVDAHEKKKPGSKDKILRGEAGPKKKVIETAPILCDRCKKNGASRNCRWCAEAAAEKAAAKKAKGEEVFVDHRKLPVAPQVESEENDLLTSCEKGGGHPFDELREDISRWSLRMTKAMKDHGADSERLYGYFVACGLVDHDKETNSARFLPLRGIGKILDLAGGGGKQLSDDRIRREYGLACGGIPWVPPLTKRRREAKKR